MSKIHTRRKHGVTTIAQIDGSLHHIRSHRLALLILIVPIGSLHSLTEEVETAFLHLVSCQGTSRNILHLSPLHIVADALEDSGRTGRITRIVASQHDGVIGIRSHHHNLLIAVQRQQLVSVLKKYDTFFCYLLSQILMSLAGDDVLRNLSPRHGFILIEIAELETSHQQALQTLVYLILIDHSRLHSLRNGAIGAAALQVGTGINSLGSCLGSSLCRTVIARHIEIVNSSAIGSNQSLESPFFSENLALKLGVGTARSTIYTLIGTHHLSHMSILYQRLEGREISLPQITGWQILQIEDVAIPLRTAMHGKMLGTSQCLDILGSLRLIRSQNTRSRQRLAVERLSLQAIHHSKSHTCGEIRIFAISLLSASPSRITEDIDIRSPEAQTLISLYITRLLRHLRLGSRLIAYGSKHLIEQGIIPGRSHVHGDRENRGISVACHAMQRLVPPLKLRDTQSGDGRRSIHHQLRLFLQGQA